MRHPILAIVGLTAALTACSSSSSNETPDPAGDNCSVHLFDDDNYADKNIVVKGEGRYGDLSSLPGATHDWTREADSFKVGSAATLTTWSEANFAGTSHSYDPGTQVPSLDDDREFASMEISCS